VPQEGESTADRILGAARAVFYEKGFFESSVDEIARRSGLSRATVYLYFKSKDEILFELLKEDLDAQIAHYRELAAIRRLALPELRGWLARFRETMDQRRRSFSLFWAGGMVNSDVLVLASRHRDNAIAILGARFPGFDLEALERGARETRRAKCYMMIFLIEEMSIAFSSSPTAPAIRTGIDLLARILLHFLRHGEIRSDP
jgi:AcrR family transcriptional regulator